MRESSPPTAGPLVSAIRDARGALAASASVDPAEASVTRRLLREFELALARLEGREPEKDLVSIVCHDLKDPLASIVMGVGYLKKTVAAETERPARRVVDAIARSADRMSQVISDFHDLSKLDAGTLEVDVRPCDVVASLRPVIFTLTQKASERSIELRFEAPNEPVVAHCDRTRLPQILSKLVDNAIKFTSPEGHVVITVDVDAGNARVAVRDTGRGIPAERFGEIFDHAANARRTPRDGPGLGLAIANGLVEAQGAG